MDDLINRQAAIDALAEAMPSLTTPDGCGEFDHDIYVTDEAFVDCMRIINGLPSVQPERKTGKWIVDALADNIYRCSECGIDAPVEPTGGTEYKSNYCQNCGADMRERRTE